MEQSNNSYYKVLILDTETTGLCDLNTPYTEDSLKTVWPYLTELGYQCAIYDKESMELEKVGPLHSLYNKEVPIRISDTVVNFTGITNEFLNSHGVSRQSIVDEFLSKLHACDFVVCYNSRYDMKILKAELMRVGNKEHIRQKPWIDPMWYGRSFCAIKGKRGYKYPKQSELYEKLTGKRPEEAHEAAADVKSLRTCFEGLVKVGVLDPQHIKAIIAKFVPQGNS